jgi:hypothetical protein
MLIIEDFNCLQVPVLPRLKMLKLKKKSCMWHYLAFYLSDIAQGPAGTAWERTAKEGEAFYLW